MDTRLGVNYSMSGLRYLASSNGRVGATVLSMPCCDLLTSAAVFFFFLFQAEDGIRDADVTGVQTCALPILLVAISFGLVLLTNSHTVYWAFLAVGLAALYPFTKRYTYYPQVALGAAYSCSILLAFSAQQGSVPAAVWLIYIANLLWTIAYDTYYAMSDREDDLKIGVKSTAVLFGDADRFIILTLQGSALFCLLLAAE